MRVCARVHVHMYARVCAYSLVSLFLPPSPSRCLSFAHPQELSYSYGRLRKKSGTKSLSHTRKCLITSTPALDLGLVGRVTEEGRGRGARARAMRMTFSETETEPDKAKKGGGEGGNSNQPVFDSCVSKGETKEAVRLLRAYEDLAISNAQVYMNMYICMYFFCICIYTYIHICIYIYIYIHTYIYACTYMYMCTYMYRNENDNGASVEGT